MDLCSLVVVFFFNFKQLCKFIFFVSKNKISVFKKNSEYNWKIKRTKEKKNNNKNRRDQTCLKDKRYKQETWWTLFNIWLEFIFEWITRFRRISSSESYCFEILLLSLYFPTFFIFHKIDVYGQYRMYRVCLQMYRNSKVLVCV